MKTKKSAMKAMIFTLAIGLIVASCGDDDNGSPVTIEVPDELTISDNDFFSEDIVIVNNTVYVSGLGDGTIKSIDLTVANPTAQPFADAEEGFAQSWGLASDGTVLLNILNNPNFEDLSANGPSKLVAYDLASGAKTDEWALPSSSISNSVPIVDGKYYVCEWAPTPRIIEIDPATGAINENWFTSSEWDPTISGLGGVIYNGSGAFYISQGNKLWYLPISNGQPGTLAEVTVTGIDVIDADGITWDGNNTLYYATNDAFNPEDDGTVYQVTFSDNVTATGSVLASGLDDTSGVWYLNNNGEEYVFILESQMGAVFGASTLEPPLNIAIVNL
ncbi:MAG: hypothetical protein AAGA66_15300 [Bacteroidota bacterium]